MARGPSRKGGRPAKAAARRPAGARTAAKRPGAPRPPAPHPPAPRAATPEEMATARQARLAGIVMAAAMVLWLGANVVGRELGLPGRYAILIDLMALGAFIWALAVTARIWHRRRNQR